MGQHVASPLVLCSGAGRAAAVDGKGLLPVGGPRTPGTATNICVQGSGVVTGGGPGELCWTATGSFCFGAGGYYHGKLIFPREFPFKPPSIYMITPNGRFKCNTRYGSVLLSGPWAGERAAAEWVPFLQVVSLHHGFPPRHMEPSLVRVHHPDWAAELHGGEGAHPGQHRDVRLHGEGWGL